MIAGIGGAAVLAVAAVAIAWASGLIFAGPSQSAWAADVCAALELDPAQNDSWVAMRDQHDAAIATLELTELPGGTEQFHTALLEGMRLVRGELNGYARSDPGGGLRPMLEDLQEIAQTRPRGPSADSALSLFYASINESQRLIRSAVESLPAKSREALEAVPGCSERL